MIYNIECLDSHRKALSEKILQKKKKKSWIPSEDAVEICFILSEERNPECTWFLLVPSALCVREAFPLLPSLAYLFLPLDHKFLKVPIVVAIVVFPALSTVPDFFFF